MKVLVVDDMRTMRRVMMQMLRSLGHSNLDEAENGVEALKKLRSQDYDLLITDLHMPNLDGRQLLEKVRHDEKLANLPVLMVSCEDDKKQIKDLIAAQVTDFIVKPFNINVLRKHLDWIKEETQIV